MRFRKNTKEDLYQFFRILRRYYSAGNSIIESLDSYRNSCTNVDVKLVMDVLIQDCKNGSSLAEAMRKHIFFAPYTIELVQIGEETGDLRKILDEIVFFLEQDLDLKRELDSGLLPVKLFLAGAAAALTITISVVLPKIGEIIKDVGAEMPFITRFMIGIGTTFQSFWWLMILLGIAGFFGYRNLKRFRPEKFEAIKDRIPFFRSIYRAEKQYRFSKILSLCSAANIPAVKCLQYTAMSVNSPLLKAVLFKAVRDVEHAGVSISDAISKADTNKLLDNDVYMMLTTGERTGDLAIVLGELAEDYRKTLLSLSKTIGGKVGASIISPVMIFIILMMGSAYVPIINAMGATGNV